jgi:allophanate hydrolase subunit 2
MRAGETLTLEAPRAGARSYIAFAGGLDLPQVMGSRATDVKGGFGGFAGRGLSRGDRLALNPAACALPPGGFGVVLEERGRMARRAGPPVELRVLLAAEFDAFTRHAHAAFTYTEWTITIDANRMVLLLS